MIWFLCLLRFLAAIPSVSHPAAWSVTTKNTKSPETNPDSFSASSPISAVKNPGSDEQSGHGGKCWLSRNAAQGKVTP